MIHLLAHLMEVIMPRRREEPMTDKDEPLQAARDADTEATRTKNAALKSVRDRLTLGAADAHVDVQTRRHAKR
jgi:hypothetical protein